MKNNLGRMKREQNFTCYYCEVKFSRFPYQATTDHLIPISRGGSDKRDNKVAACWTCNNLKGPLTYQEFIEVRHDKEKLRKALGEACRKIEEAVGVNKKKPWRISEKGFEVLEEFARRPGEKVQRD